MQYNENIKYLDLSYISGYDLFHISTSTALFFLALSNNFTCPLISQEEGQTFFIFFLIKSTIPDDLPYHPGPLS